MLPVQCILQLTGGALPKDIRQTLNSQSYVLASYRAQITTTLVYKEQKSQQAEKDKDKCSDPGFNPPPPQQVVPKTLKTEFTNLLLVP